VLARLIVEAKLSSAQLAKLGADAGPRHADADGRPAQHPLRAGYVAFAADGRRPGKPRREFLSPRYTTDWDELLRV
jgi:hypothetical protein